MTDPNKAAVTESNAEFVARIVASQPRIHTGYITISTSDMERLLQGFETAALIEEHHIVPTYHKNAHAQWWGGKTFFGKSICKEYGEGDTLHEAVRAVVDKIKDGK